MVKKIPKSFHGTSSQVAPVLDGMYEVDEGRKLTLAATGPLQSLGQYLVGGRKQCCGEEILRGSTGSGADTHVTFWIKGWAERVQDPEAVSSPWRSLGQL